VPVALYYLRKDPKNSFPKKLLTHDTVTRQCRKFISKLQKEGVIVEIRNSTGEAALEASQNPEVAVIASQEAEQKYGLQRMLPDSVADVQGNVTRFWILAKSYTKKTGQDKTSFLVNLEQTKSGALWQALGCFARRKINLLLVYPNSIPGKHWEYTFLMEFSGHIDDPELEGAWEELRNSGLITGRPHLLGSYPSATN
jgi:prephenate dehydratase